MHLCVRSVTQAVFASGLIPTTTCRRESPKKYKISQYNTRRNTHRSLKNTSHSIKEHHDIIIMIQFTKHMNSTDFTSSFVCTHTVRYIHHSLRVVRSSEHFLTDIMCSCTHKFHNRIWSPRISEPAHDPSCASPSSKKMSAPYRQRDNAKIQFFNTNVNCRPVFRIITTYLDLQKKTLLSCWKIAAI